MLRERRGAVLVAGVVATALAAALLLIASGGATGSSAEHCARLSAQSRARELHPTGTGRHVVVIGDSYSVGLGLRNPTASWPSRLPGHVEVFGFSGSGFSAHASPCGPRVEYAARAPGALRTGADLVVVEGGLNDYDQPTSAIRAGFRSLVSELSTENLLVVGPARAPARAAGAERVDALLAEECARAGVRYLSMLGDRLSYLDDSLHLTPGGHRAFGATVAAALGS